MWSRAASVIAISAFDNRGGNHSGKRVILVDPENPRNRVEYDDLGLGEGRKPDRQSLVTLYPEHAIFREKGEGDEGQYVVTHSAAVADMRIMIENHGYVVQSITRDLFF